MKRKDKGYEINFLVKLNCNSKIYPICFVLHFYLVKVYKGGALLYIMKTLPYILKTCVIWDEPIKEDYP